MSIVQPQPPSPLEASAGVSAAIPQAGLSDLRACKNADVGVRAPANRRTACTPIEATTK
jgi:hypothetical protein